MVRWSDIQTEYKGMEVGFRERVVQLFRKYEGQETDEKVRGKIVLVSQKSFAEHMGIPVKTFNNWCLGQANVARPTDPDPAPTCVNEGVPPKYGFVHEVNERLKECLPLLSLLSNDTHELILEDIQVTRGLLDQIEQAIQKAKENSED